MPAPCFVGVDAGGTKTEVLVVSNGRRARHVAAGVNLRRDGLDTASGVLEQAIHQALAVVSPDGGSPLAGVCAGVAGAGSAEDAEALAQRLSSGLGGAALDVRHDAEIALEGAFEGGSGLVVVVGTGSVAFARDEDGETALAGGWGSLLGDDGSGYALGQAGLRAVANDFDGGEPTALRHRLERAYGIDSRHAFIQRAYGGAFAVPEVAPMLIEAAEHNDWTATRIIKQQANTLAKQVGWLAGRLGENIQQRIALVGGLTGEAYYRESLAEALLRHLPRWRLVQPLSSPAEGALRLAQALGA